LIAKINFRANRGGGIGRIRRTSSANLEKVTSQTTKAKRAVRSRGSEFRQKTSQAKNKGKGEYKKGGGLRWKGGETDGGETVGFGGRKYNPKLDRKPKNKQRSNPSPVGVRTKRLSGRNSNQQKRFQLSGKTPQNCNSDCRPASLL